MSRPFNDTTVEEAKKEIHRRLLREEKLKRIERKEMRRLASTGWQPPRGGPAAHRGPSVHDAADAIEVTEWAFAREAQRRAEEQLRPSRVPSAPLLDKYRLIPPAPAADNGALHRELDTTQEMLNRVERNLREGEANNAADMLRHYLDRSGRTIHFMPRELRRYEEINDAEKRVQDYFIDWMIKPQSWTELTYGEDGTIGNRHVESNFQRIAPKLLALRDGDTLRDHSYWESRLQYPLPIVQGGKWHDRTGLSDISSVDLEGFAGKAKTRGDGDFSFKRRGNLIDFEGNVEQSFDEPYNFENGTSFNKMSRNLTEIRDQFSGDEARRLAQHARAKDFQMKALWPRRATGQLRVNDDGTLSLETVEWTDIDPYEYRPWP